MATDDGAIASQQQNSNYIKSSTSANPNSSNSDPVHPVESGRRSNVQFSKDTRASSRSPMSNQRRPSASEITPIISAENNAGRNYDTNEQNSQQPDADGNVAPKSKPTSNTDRNEEDENSEETAWYKKVAEKFGSITLENKGSVARDHLALERTFLAWLRTSLAFASIGVAITQLFRLNTTIASRTKQYATTSADGQSGLPLSPFLGQSIPIELLPYLQQAINSAAPSMATLGPTLLDQIFLQPAISGSGNLQTASNIIQAAAFDEEAAAKLRRTGKPLGATFLGISIVILLIGFHRYFESQHWIIRGKFPASRGSIFLVGFIAGALILASLLVVLLVAPTSYEKK